MDLVTRYLNAVRWNLPSDVRGDDVVAELGDVIASRIEDREEALGRSLTRDETSTLLRDFGHPLVVGARYGKQQWLIGPEVFPFWLFTIKVVLALQIASVLIIAGVQTLSASLSHPWRGGFAHTLMGIPWTLLAPAAIVTLVFALVERTGGMSGYLKRWKPEQLPDLPAGLRWGKRRPNGVWSLLFEMAAAVLFLLWWTGLVAFPTAQMEGRHMVIPIATPVWMDFYWPILGLAVAKLLHDLIQLLRPRWTVLRLLIGSAIALTWLVVIFGLDRAGRLIVVPPGRFDPFEQAIVQGKVDHGIHVALLWAAAVVAILWLVELWRLTRMPKS